MVSTPALFTWDCTILICILLTCWFAVGPWSELHVALIALGCIGTEVRFQGFTQDTSRNVRVLDVAAITTNRKIMESLVSVCVCANNKLRNSRSFRT